MKEEREIEDRTEENLIFSNKLDLYIKLRIIRLYHLPFSLLKINLFDFGLIFASLRFKILTGSIFLWLDFLGHSQYQKYEQHQSISKDHLQIPKERWFHWFFALVGELQSQRQE